MSDDLIERLREHIAQQQLDIVTLGQEVGRLREALRELAEDWECCGVSKAMRQVARAALGEEKK
jgi:hypothetical protein